MKKLPKSALTLLFVFYFFAGFALAFILITPYIEAQNTNSVENQNPPDYEVLVFTTNNIQIVELGKLEEFKRRYPDYSFLGTIGSEKFYTEKLNDKNKTLIFNIEFEPLSQDRQLITVSSNSGRNIVKNSYEATAKEVFPKTTMYLNFRYTPFKLLVSSIGGALVCLVFYLIYRKHSIV